MYHNDNDARYPSPYRQTQLPPARRLPSVAGNARYVHDIHSALSPRALPSKDLKEPTNRWDHHPAYGNHERRNSQPYYYPSAALHQSNPSSRYQQPMRQYAYAPREVEPEKEDASIRREYSPPRRERSVDGSFKGFTTPFPGSEAGRRNENLEDDVRRRPSYRMESQQRSPARSQRYPAHLPGAPNENLHNDNDSRYRHQYMNYNPQQPPPYNQPSATDYPREPYRPSMADHPSSMRGPSETRYTASDVGSSISQRGRPPHGYHDRRWEDSSQYAHASMDPDSLSPNVDQSRLSPRTFQRECQRAYYEARNQRMRNLEEGLYGKCKWATYDSKYC